MDSQDLKPFPAENSWAELCLEAVSYAFLNTEMKNFHCMPQRALTPLTLKSSSPLHLRDLMCQGQHKHFRKEAQLPRFSEQSRSVPMFDALGSRRGEPTCQKSSLAGRPTCRDCDTTGPPPVVNPKFLTVARAARVKNDEK